MGNGVILLLIIVLFSIGLIGCAPSGSQNDSNDDNKKPIVNDKENNDNEEDDDTTRYPVVGDEEEDNNQTEEDNDNSGNDNDDSQTGTEGDNEEDGGSEVTPQPPIVEEEPSQQELEEFRQLLDSKATGNLLDYAIQGGKIYTFEETNSALTINYLTLYEGEGIETTAQLEALSEAVDTYGLRKFNSISRENTTVDYNGYTYGFNSVGGGVLGLSANRTSIADFQKIADSNSPTGFSVEVDVMLENQNGVFEYSATAPIDEGAEATAMFDALKGLSADDWTITQVSNTQVLGNSSIVFAEPTQIKTEEGGTTGGGTDNPNPDTPDDEVTDPLDFSALETKLEEVIEAKSPLMYVEKIISYKVENNKLIALAYVSSSKTDSKTIRELACDVSNDFSSQDSLNSLINEVSSTSASVSTIVRMTEPFTYKGIEYCKEGVEGVNDIASAFGIYNPKKTYIARVGGTSLHTGSSTNYASNIIALIIYQKERKEIVEVHDAYVVTVIGEESTEQKLQALEDGKFVTNEITYVYEKEQEETETDLNSSAKYSSVEPFFSLKTKFHLIFLYNKIETKII